MEPNPGEIIDRFQRRLLRRPMKVKREYFCLLILLCLLCTLPAVGQDTTLFVDVSEQAGLSKKHRIAEGWARMGFGTGAAWFDYDRDGDLDLYLPHGKGKNDLYRNEGDGTFVEVATEMNAEDRYHRGAAVAAADYDNDGWVDLYLANADEDVLLRNLQGTGFEDVTAAVGLNTLPEARSLSASWGDYDGDGYLDLYIANHVHLLTTDPEHSDRLLRNNAGQSFTDVTDLLIPEHVNGYGFIGTWTDFDNDRDLDVLLINDCGFQLEGTTHTRLFRNDGGTDPFAWNFTEVSAEVGADHCHSGMGVAVGDYNRDGWMDYYYTNIGPETLLLENNQGVFKDVADSVGVRAVNPDGIQLWSWGTNFFDYNLDGYLDLFVDAGTLYIFTTELDDPQPNLLFSGSEEGLFEDVSLISGLDSPLRSRSSIYGDYDNDGDPDMYIVNANQDVFLYENRASENNNWLIVDLVGAFPASNRDAIGARIKLTDQSQAFDQYWETRSGSSLGGGDDVAAYFGLGASEGPFDIEVQWPSGQVTVFQNIAFNSRIELVEPEVTSSEEANDLSGSLSLSVYPNPFSETISSRFYLHPNEQATLTLFDVTGRTIRTEQVRAGLGGWKTMRWDLNREIASGTYMLELRTARGARMTRPVIRLR